MKTRIFFLLMMAIFFGQIHTAIAQQAEPTYYIIYDYMKVKPGKWEDYMKLEKAFKKIHAARKKAGKMDDWGLLWVLSPNGANTEYDYVTFNAFAGDAQLANHYEGQFMPDNWSNLLTPDEIEVVMNAEEIRTLVKSEVWTALDRVLADDVKTAKISVFNYFGFPEGGSHEKHVKAETDIWKPIHAARVKDGTMKGWRLLQMQMPFGAGMPYHDATVDLYANMSQYLAQWFDKYFSKVHPGKDVNAMLKQTEESCTLLRGEVRMVIDRLDWSN
jgi:hypothetical protein